MRFFKLYLLALVIFASIDFIWLTIIAKNLYKEQIGFLMADSFRMGPAILFYLIFLFGLVFFAVSPTLRAGTLIDSILVGALFGFICYATYDLTNLATLKQWPVKIVVIDLAWGAFISGSTSAICHLIGSHWKHFFR